MKMKPTGKHQSFIAATLTTARTSYTTTSTGKTITFQHNHYPPNSHPTSTCNGVMVDYGMLMHRTKTNDHPARQRVHPDPGKSQNSKLSNPSPRVMAQKMNSSTETRLRHLMTTRPVPPPLTLPPLKQTTTLAHPKPPPKRNVNAVSSKTTAARPHRPNAHPANHAPKPLCTPPLTRRLSSGTRADKARVWGRRRGNVGWESLL